jgi:hypothetical protein
MTDLLAWLPLLIPVLIIVLVVVAIERNNAPLPPLDDDDYDADTFSRGAGGPMMSNHVSLLHDLRSGKPCNQEAVAAIEDLEAQLAEALEATEEVHHAKALLWDELAKVRELLRAFGVAANTVDYCYRNRPENFAVALRELMEKEATVREALAGGEG